MSEIFTTLLVNNIGKSVDDLKHNFTMDQIYHFYGECRKLEMQDWKMNAMIMAQALIYVTPSEKTNEARKKQKNWEKFMDSLTWEKLEKKNIKGKDAGSFIRMFQSTGLIPIQKKDGAK